MAELVIKLVNGELAGKTAQEIAKQIREAGTAARKAQVGTQAWVDAHAKLDKAKALQEDLTKQVKATTAASDMLKAAWNNLPGAQFFNQVGDSIGMLKSGVGGLVSQFGVLKFAIASTGIGLIVLAVMSLIGAFSKFTPIVDKVEQVLSGISAVITELIQRVQSFGMGLFKIITGAPGGVDQLSSSFDGLADSISNAYDAGVQLKILQQDLEDAARGMEIANARAEKQVEKLIIMSKNKSRSDREQIELLLQARKIAEESAQKDDEFQQKKFDALMTEAKLASRLNEEEIIQLVEGTLAQEIEYEKRGQLGDDLLDKIKDALVERINAEGNAGKILEKIQNAENQRLEKQQAEREAARKKAIDAELKELKEAQAAQDNIRKLQNEKRLLEIDDEHAREIEKINIDTEEKIINLQGSEAQILEQMKILREIQGEELAAIDKKWAEKRAEDDKKAREKKLEDTLAQHDLNLVTDQNLINERFVANQINEQQFRELSIQNVLTHEQEKLAVLKAAHGEQSAEYQEAYADFLMLQKDAADASVEVTEKLSADQMAALQGGLQVFGNVFGSMASMYEEGTKRWKTMAVAQGMISAVQGAVNAYSSTAAIPIIGPGLAPIAAGLALAAGYANVRKIEKTEVKSPVKKEFGGYLDGPRHSQGGIPIEAEGGEFIFSRKAVQAIGVNHLNRVNNFYTRRFSAGGPVNPFPDRAPVSSGASQSIAGGDGSMAELKDFLINNFMAINSRIDRIKVQNVVTETEDALKTVNLIKADADI